MSAQCRNCKSDLGRGGNARSFYEGAPLAAVYPQQVPFKLMRKQQYCHYKESKTLTVNFDSLPADGTAIRFYRKLPIEKKKHNNCRDFVTWHSHMVWIWATKERACTWQRERCEESGAIQLCCVTLDDTSRFHSPLSSSGPKNMPDPHTLLQKKKKKKMFWFAPLAISHIM